MPEADSMRTVFWTLYMLGVVVVAAYSATLVSFLTVAGNDLSYDSLADLKRIRTHRLGILKGSVLEEYFKVRYWRNTHTLSQRRHFLIEYKIPSYTVFEKSHENIKGRRYSSLYQI